MHCEKILKQTLFCSALSLLSFNGETKYFARGSKTVGIHPLLPIQPHVLVFTFDFTNTDALGKVSFCEEDRFNVNF